MIVEGFIVKGDRFVGLGWLKSGRGDRAARGWYSNGLFTRREISGISKKNCNINAEYFVRNNQLKSEKSKAAFITSCLIIISSSIYISHPDPPF